MQSRRFSIKKTAVYSGLTSLFAVLLVGACSVSNVGDKTICAIGSCKTSSNIQQKPTLQPTASPTPIPVVPHDAKTVMSLLRQNCKGCHGAGQDKRSFWPMPVEFDLPTVAELLAQGTDPAIQETFDKFVENNESLEKLISKIEADQFSVEVFQSIENNLLGRMEGKPKGMPYMVPMKGEEAEDFKRVLAWFQSRLPFVVADARAKYHVKDLSIGVPVNFQYSCSSLVTGRDFLNRLAQDALGRSLRQSELESFGKIDGTVTKEMREKAVARLAGEWKKEFLDYGLKQFAEKIGSSGRIRQSQIIVDPLLREDIAGEFYELVKAMVNEGKSYKEILQTSRVFATKLTAPYYGRDCLDKFKLPENANKKYVECTMASPRGTYFTTLGFLASKPSSMFFENNNYGRVSAMNEVIRGETLLPNTEGETGGRINDLPTCFVTNDWRVLAQGEGKYAPRGAAKIPATGNFCQGCHINRQLASGSIAFRPFGPIGEWLGEYVKSSSGSEHYIDWVMRGGAERPAQEKLLKSYILEARSKTDQSGVVEGGNNWANMPPEATRPLPVDETVFIEWLNIGNGAGQERGCVQENGRTVSVTSVEDLYKYYVTDDLVLARGLSRIVPRAMSNLNATNQEIIEGVLKAWKSGNGQLLPIFQSYFASETFSCKSSGGN